MVAAGQLTGKRQDSPDQQSLAVILRSPGQVDMAGVKALANALKQPLSLISKAVYQTPTVLMRDVDRRNSVEISEHCKVLGLDIEFAANDVILPEITERFDVAVHINNPEYIPLATETLARILGVAPEKAFRLLATPPGIILGDVSQAAADALARRFGQHCTVSATPSGEGVYDLYLPPEVPVDSLLDKRCAGRRGLVMLGVDQDEANVLFKRLPKGTARLIPRALLRFDLLLVGQPEDQEPAEVWLREYLYEKPGMDPGQVALLYNHLPVALAEGEDYQTIAGLHREATAAGLVTEIEANGFLRNHIQLTEVTDRAAVADTLRKAGLQMPLRLPARIAENLPDLDARWLARQLRCAGASVLFEEVES